VLTAEELEMNNTVSRDQVLMVDVVAEMSTDEQFVEAFKLIVNDGEIDASEVAVAVCSLATLVSPKTFIKIANVYSSNKIKATKDRNEFIVED
jgi:hypothetical protein